MSTLSILSSLVSRRDSVWTTTFGRDFYYCGFLSPSNPETTSVLTVRSRVNGSKSEESTFLFFFLGF